MCIWLHKTQKQAGAYSVQLDCIKRNLLPNTTPDLPCSAGLSFVTVKESQDDEEAQSAADCNVFAFLSIF